MSIKEIIKKLPWINNVARKIYKKHKGTWRLDPSHWIPLVLTEPQGIAIQIGSNDGKTNDPLHRWLKKEKNWSAIFVEPVPHLFNRLKNNYPQESRFSFENIVINDGQPTTFYWVSDTAKSTLPNLPSWHDQLGGFNRDHITSHLPELEPFIESVILTGCTLTELIKKYNIDKLDLLHIDTEGADFKILKQLNLESIKPTVILFEQKHLTKNEEIAATNFLKKDYILYNLGPDILAIEKRRNTTLKATLSPILNLIIPG